MYLVKNDILDLIRKGKLIIRPLLDENQIGEISIDFRLGYDFLVTVQGREPFIDASLNNEEKHPITSFFQETRRTIGETFLLHPNQTVLTSSLEYIKLPNDVLIELNVRSSYARLGLNISTIVQPGYIGCVSIELTNSNKNPVNLTIGAPIVQGRFCKIKEPLNYFYKDRKYICQVRPPISAANEDKDLIILNELWKKTHNRK
ncbi:MAG: dCTP deaminase [Bacteroidia bacterium]